MCNSAGRSREVRLPTIQSRKGSVNSPPGRLRSRPPLLGLPYLRPPCSTTKCATTGIRHVSPWPAPREMLAPSERETNTWRGDGADSAARRPRPGAVTAAAPALTPSPRPRAARRGDGTAPAPIPAGRRTRADTATGADSSRALPGPDRRRFRPRAASPTTPTPATPTTPMPARRAAAQRHAGSSHVALAESFLQQHMLGTHRRAAFIRCRQEIDQGPILGKGPKELIGGVSNHLRCRSRFPLAFRPRALGISRPVGRYGRDIMSLLDGNDKGIARLRHAHTRGVETE